MFQFAAPHPSIQTTSLYPDPQVGDSESLTVVVTRKTAMNGVRRTYVKRKGNRRKLLWTFRLSRNKALELRAFIYAYFASKIRVTDHNNRVWIGNFTNNPFEFDTPERAEPAITPMPRGEAQVIEIEFEGVEQ
jgi:hypothetical protein